MGFGFQRYRRGDLEVLGIRRRQERAAAQALGEWVGRHPWEFYMTGTFRGDYTGLQLARSRWLEFAGWLCETGGAEPTYVIAFEEHPRRECNPVHVHGLMCVAQQLRPFEMWEEWWTRYGVNRVVRVPTMEDVAHVATYIGKYLGKGGVVEFSPNFATIAGLGAQGVLL